MTVSDEHLAERAPRDRAAFGELYDRHVRAVFGFHVIRTLSRETAEDLTSTTFMKALEHVGRFRDRGEGSFRAWLFTIAHNALTDHQRKIQYHAHLDDIDFAELVPSAKRTEAATELAMITNALQKLPQTQRDLILLRVFDDLPYRDIARIVGKSEGACKVAFSRAIHDLRTALPLSVYVFIAFHL